MNQSFFRKKSIIKLQEEYSNSETSKLNRVLGVKDLTLFGMAAMIGAGIFSTVGSACADGGPAVIGLFIGIAITCGFSALCYAEMASRIPVSGSAYTYAYTTFGELIAWIIGWDLIMEYAIGNITVAISWSGNLVTFLHQIGVHLPEYLTKSFLEVKNINQEYLNNIANNVAVTDYMQQMHQLWVNAPHIGSFPIILNLPAFAITFIITALVYIGIKESKNISNAMVVFKIIVILLIIILGAFYVQPKNWSPFAPNGIDGVLKGTSAIFFAYIGFDALATTAEECKSPQTDIPKSMIYSLIAATILYIAIAIVLTGMVNYSSLNNEAFLANAFLNRGVQWIGGMVAASAVIATASVLLVFQLGQPRIWMSMSRDGLLPKKFAEIHPRYKTPKFATIITGLLVGIPSLFMDAAFVTDMCSIGTLFAFVLVCAGVMILQNQNDLPKPKFRIPYINSRWGIIFVSIAMVIYFLQNNEVGISNFNTIFNFEGGYEVWKHSIPTWLFYISYILIALIAWKKKYSLIPFLGVICCLYLLSTLGIVNWLRFIIWLIIGMTVYYFYGKKNSKLNTKN